jgi:hypothetical protein
MGESTQLVLTREESITIAYNSAYAAKEDIHITKSELDIFIYLLVMQVGQIFYSKHPLT